MMKRPLLPVVLSALVAALMAGCSAGGADKAGGSRAPVVLRLAVAYAGDLPDAPAARWFASRVGELSGGSVRVRVVFDAAGQQIVDPEARVAQMVHGGRFDLGWIGSRAWDRMGVTTFRALQAPFLVTSYALLDGIATGPLASRMLAGLNGRGFVGLGLVPEHLRHPFGVDRPLASPADFAGARVRVIPSRATEALMRALGATPVHVSNDGIDTAMSAGRIDGTEHSLGGPWPGGHYVTANVALFAKAITVFAGRPAYERLDDEQRDALRTAAVETVARVSAHPPRESELVRRFCDVGRAVTAGADDLAALARAARPVYAQLERDAQTRAMIAAIVRLKATVPAPRVAVPGGCARAVPAARGPRTSPSTLNGTYRWRLTRAGAAAAGSPNDSDIGNIATLTLRDGRWLLGEGPGDTGTYEITGDRIVFDWPATASRLTFTFRRRAGGDLDVEPVLPMDRGDRFVWASAPWRRVGPPVRTIP